MSTAVAAAPAATALPTMPERHLSPRQFAAIAPSASGPSMSEPAPKRARSNGSPGSGDLSNAPSVTRSNSNGKDSPPSVRNGQSLSIKVKKEPASSPSVHSARPRPKRLDLSTSTPDGRGPQGGKPSAPLTSRESAGLAIQDVGLACLSPGFQTNDPGMREQLQRSLDVRDQQRQIIEARQKGLKPGSSLDNGDSGPRSQDASLFGLQTRTPRRKGPPPGLSINAPPAAQFADDRVIQSAPMHQTFTGLRPGEHPFTRHVQQGPSGLSQTSHIHHVPATQTNNRLPPISDVLANDRLDPPRSYGNPHSPSHAPQPIPSPGYPPHHPLHTHQHQHQHQHQQHQQQSTQAQPLNSRLCEFRSAEEAMQGLSGGREDLMPKVVHYGGVQPPTPPSPMHRHHPQPQAAQQSSSAGAQQPPAPTTSSHAYPSASDSAPSRPEILARMASMNGARRRGREEFERDSGNGSPPSRSDPKRATFDRIAAAEDDWRASMSSAEKKQEFLRLCERAWDLFHS